MVRFMTTTECLGRVRLVVALGQIVWTVANSMTKIDILESLCQK